MRSINVTMWVTLDGVVQGLGRPDEDTRGGFIHGGWGPRYNDRRDHRALHPPVRRNRAAPGWRAPAAGARARRCGQASSRSVCRASRTKSRSCASTGAPTRIATAATRQSVSE